MKKSLAKKLSSFFEKKPRQKTLVGCAANSKAGAAFTQVAPRTERPTLRSQKLCVDNALGLAGKPLDRLWLDERDLCVDAEYRAQARMNHICQMLQIGIPLQQRRVDQLDLDLKRIRIALVAI